MIQVLISRPGQYEDGMMVGAPQLRSVLGESDISTEWELAAALQTVERERRLLIITTAVPIEFAICGKGESPAGVEPVSVDSPEGGRTAAVWLLSNGPSSIYVRSLA